MSCTYTYGILHFYTFIHVTKLCLEMLTTRDHDTMLCLEKSTSPNYGHDIKCDKCRNGIRKKKGGGG